MLSHLDQHKPIKMEIDLAVLTEPDDEKIAHDLFTMCCYLESDGVLRSRSEGTTKFSICVLCILKVTTYLVVMIAMPTSIDKHDF